MRYYVSAKIDNVMMVLFHSDNLPQDVYEKEIPNYHNLPDEEKIYMESQVEETFDEKEAELLREYLSNFKGFSVEVKEARPPRLGYMGVRAFAGGSDFYKFDHHENYPLPFRVWGYYDQMEREALAESSK